MYVQCTVVSVADLRQRITCNALNVSLYIGDNACLVLLACCDAILFMVFLFAIALD